MQTFLPILSNHIKRPEGAYEVLKKSEHLNNFTNKKAKNLFICKANFGTIVIRYYSV